METDRKLRSSRGAAANKARSDSLLIAADDAYERDITLTTLKSVHRGDALPRRSCYQPFTEDSFRRNALTLPCPPRARLRCVEPVHAAPAVAKDASLMNCGQLFRHLARRPHAAWPIKENARIRYRIQFDRVFVAWSFAET